MVFKNINFFIICGIITVRLLGAYLVQTSFVPDEYWQSLEVAHNMTFGYGYFTWEWKKKIRSFIYPLIFHILYSLLPDSPAFIIHSPKIFQAMLTAIGDIFTYKLSLELFGKNCGLWTVFNLTTSWFLFYCAPRTLTNMAEASFSSCGLYFYPWPKKREKGFTFKYLWFAGASIMMRPTGFILWLPLYLWHISREKLSVTLKSTVFIGFILLSVLLISDKWYYGQWVFTPFNFFFFNWSSDIGAFYGSHHFLWYFMIGLPTVLSVHAIPFLMGLSLSQLKSFYFIILWFLLIFSVPSHKEFRFLLPVVPLCMVICSVVMNEISSGRMHILQLRISEKFVWLITFAILVVNIPLSLYMGIFHQAGTIKATMFLSEKSDKVSSILFLMPCHSTPYYSYIHKNISMRFLTCEPNFGENPGYTEEADNFYADPLTWLYENYQSNHSTLPSHIVMFDTLNNQISEFLERYGYQHCFKAFHSHFASGRTGKYVYVFCK